MGYIKGGDDNVKKKMCWVFLMEFESGMFELTLKQATPRDGSMDLYLGCLSLRSNRRP